MLRPLLRVALAIGLIVGALVLMGGCAAIPAAGERAADQVRDVNELATDAAMRQLCFGISRRELRQRFASIEKAQALNRVCDDALPVESFVPLPPTDLPRVGG